ncbi:NG_NG-dimethylarginine dimethylaminohydrolase 1, partial [Caligus rogercresseyi]
MSAISFHSFSFTDGSILSQGRAAVAHRSPTEPLHDCSSNSIYVRDLAIIHNGVALICRPSKDSSRDVE